MTAELIHLLTCHRVPPATPGEMQSRMLSCRDIFHSCNHKDGRSLMRRRRIPSAWKSVARVTSVAMVLFLAAAMPVGDRVASILGASPASAWQVYRPISLADMDKVCSWQYGKGAYAENWNRWNRYGWNCYRLTYSVSLPLGVSVSKNKLGGLDLYGWCRSLGYQNVKAVSVSTNPYGGSTSGGATPTGWACYESG